MITDLSSRPDLEAFSNSSAEADIQPQPQGSRGVFSSTSASEREVDENDSTTPRGKRLSRTLSYAKGGSNVQDTNVETGQKRYDIDDPFANRGVDVDLMLYSLERKAIKKQKCKELLFYIPFAILAIIWLTFSTQIDDGYWMNAGLKVRNLLQMIFFLNTIFTNVKCHVSTNRICFLTKNFQTMT